jgi:hypothetical protein
LNYTGVSDAGLALLSGLENLRSLGLDSTFVTDQSREVFLSLRKLEKLNLYHTVVTGKVEQELKSGFAGLPDHLG